MSARHIALFLLFVQLIPALALYEGDSAVKLLTPETFPKMLKSKGIWLVEFFCKHTCDYFSTRMRALRLRSSRIREGSGHPRRSHSHRCCGHEPARFTGAAIWHSRIPNFQTIRRGQEQAYGLSRSAIGPRLCAVLPYPNEVNHNPSSQ